MVKLIIEDDEGKTTVVPLIRDDISIGRKEGNTIRLTERNVSRRHARLLKQNGAVFIEDLKSYNGIRVNGNAISGRVAVTEGDRIQIGDYILALKVEGAAQVKDDAPTIQDDPSFDHPDELAEDDATERMAVDIPAARVGSLVCVSSNFAGRKFELGKSMMTIGRDEDANALVINHRSISRQHARIVEEDGQYTIIDLGSQNGVRVNGDEYGKVELRAGDQIDLGHVRLRFIAPGEDFVFSRDAVVVDLAKMASESTTRKLLVVAAILAVAVVGFFVWQYRDKPDPDIGDRTLPPTTDQIPPTTIEDERGRLLKKLDSALAQSQWPTAAKYCDKLDATGKQLAKAKCAQATTEIGAKAIWEKAHAAETKNEHAAALRLLATIPTTSQLSSGLQRSSLYQKARAKYLGQAHASLDDLAKEAKCKEVKQALAEIAKIVSNDKEGEKKLKECEARVHAAATPATTNVPPTTITKKPPTTITKKPPPTITKKPPAKVTKKPPTKVVVKKTPRKEPTEEEKAKAKDLLTQARAAYMHAHHAQAIKLAEDAMKLSPVVKSDAYQIVGASSCFLGNKRKAGRAYRHVSPKGKQLLKQVCLKLSITLP